MPSLLERLKAKLGFGWAAAQTKEPSDSAPAGRLVSKPAAMRQRRVYVGLDFGTCSCKAVVQVDPEDRIRRRFYAIAHPSAPTHTPSVLCPSTVDVRGDAFLFGYQAEANDSKLAVRSFKMCMPCLGGDSHTNGSCPRCDTRKPGHFMLGGEWWSAEEISILFLANVLRGINDTVLVHLAGEAAQIFVNSAAPLDQMPENSSLGHAFQRVLYYANQLRDKACNPWPIAAARAALNEIGHKHQGVPDLNDSATTVFPETHAAMTSVLAPLRVNRNFAIVDIGAGTTDVAFFYYHRTGGEPEACYYEAKSEFVGMDQIDAALHKEVPVGSSLRSWREGLSADAVSELHPHFVKPIDAMFHHFKKCFGKSYMCNRGFEHWDEFTVYMSGGGAQFRPLPAHFQLPFEFIMGTRELSVEVPDLPNTVQLLAVDASILPMKGLNGERPLLLLAYGLAHGAATIAKWVTDYSFNPQRGVRQNDHIEEYI